MLLIYIKTFYLKEAIININKLKKIHNEFKNEFLKTKINNQKYTIIETKKLINSPMWTAEYFDETFSLFDKLKFKKIKLKEIAKIEKGIEPGSDSYISNFDKNDSDVAFIKTSELANHEVNFTCKNYIDKNLHEKIIQDIKIKDLLFTKDGKIGDVAIVTSKNSFVFGSGIVKIRILKNNYSITPEFIFMLLTLKEFGQFFAKKYSVRGTTIPHLRQFWIENMKIPILNKKIIDKYTKLIKKIIKYF